MTKQQPKGGMLSMFAQICGATQRRSNIRCSLGKFNNLHIPFATYVNSSAPSSELHKHFSLKCVIPPPWWYVGSTNMETGSIPLIRVISAFDVGLFQQTNWWRSYANFDINLMERTPDPHILFSNVTFLSRELDIVMHGIISQDFLGGGDMK